MAKPRCRAPCDAGVRLLPELGRLELNRDARLGARRGRLDLLEQPELVDALGVGPHAHPVRVALDGGYLLEQVAQERHIGVLDDRVHARGGEVELEHGAGHDPFQQAPPTVPWLPGGGLWSTGSQPRGGDGSDQDQIRKSVIVLPLGTFDPEPGSVEKT